MTSDSQRLYKALSSRDARFDGVFFVGVTSTGVYCRPICPARTPKSANCRFFPAAHEAEQAGFRPCLRCRPELAPGNAPVDDAGRIARAIVDRLEAGAFDEKSGLEAIASQFELSSRQLRRIIHSELGVPPVQLLLTRRLLLAKQLLTDTSLPVTEVAFASGFSSLRRFNDAFSRRYRMPPTRLRQRGTTGRGPSLEQTTSVLQLTYRPPYDWNSLLRFLALRALGRVEHVTDDAYARTVQLGKAKGWLRVTHAPQKRALMIEFTHSLMPVLPTLLGRVRALFDLDARPALISSHLGRDPHLSAALRAHPGLRVPGTFSGFELGIRAILGQQVTVKSATRMSSRVVEIFGDPIETPFAELTRLSPQPARLADTAVNEIARLGIIAGRAKSIIALARAQATEALCLDGILHRDPDAAITRLAELPGIGPWTAHYIAMRALRWPDAFPKEDVAVRKALGGVTAAQAEQLSHAWRPWRSYAVMHLWSGAAQRSSADGATS